MDKEKFDFWYAVNNTRIVLMPSRTLETFGTTMLKYHLVTELMDQINRIRIREGKITASRPQIITPASAQEALEGFGEEARRYIDWLKKHEQHLRILQYGFAITKQEISEQVLTSDLQSVVDRIESDVKSRAEPMSAVVVGVDEPWEVCLLKLLRDVVSASAPGNLQELTRRESGDDLRESIERDFLAAARDPSLTRKLGEKLQRYNLFSEYEDRFFALVRSQGRR